MCFQKNDKLRKMIQSKGMILFVFLLFALVFPFSTFSFQKTVSAENNNSTDTAAQIGADEKEVGQAKITSKDYYRIDILGDPHLPGRDLDKKKIVIEHINVWKDSDLVVVPGDLCQTTGTDRELKCAVSFFSQLKKNTIILNGNHDYVFQDIDVNNPVLTLGNPESKAQKLRAFLNAFNKAEPYTSLAIPGYHLIFLAPDEIHGDVYAEMSQKQLKWFEYELFSNRNTPTIVFFHAPLWSKNVLKTNPKLVNYLAQPLNELSRIVLDNPQVKLWVAGHVHFGVFNPVNSSPINVFEERVNNIVCCDIDGRSILAGTEINLEKHENIWTKSLFLYHDRIVVKVFDHISNNWIDQLERKFKLCDDQ
ncbi:MAG: metallophosphoesterase [Candidatus Riflebacteria bacterium]|nr:metallophosphoesterase [Candidatus Riflebacteria bacterium]